MKHSFQDTLDSIRARTQEKVAASQPGGVESTVSTELRTLAAVLRKVAEAPDALTYNELYAVQSGRFPVSVAPQARTFEGPGAELRKLAHALRSYEHAQGLRKVAQARDLHLAAQGLTILRDLSGS